MRGAGSILALAKYIGCPAYPRDAVWIPGTHAECFDCSLNKQVEIGLYESTTICELLARIDETGVADEQGLA